MTRRSAVVAWWCIGVLAYAGVWGQGAAQQDLGRAQEMRLKAENYLKAHQKPDGGWQEEKDPPAMTAIALKALVQNPQYSVKGDPFISKGYGKLLSYQLDTGGIYKDMLANYNTAIAVSSLAAAKDPAFEPQIAKAVAYLKGLQFMRSADSAAASAKFIDQWYGGWGYEERPRGTGRPDMSNVQMAIQALHDAGLKADDPAFVAARKFITRQQNLSETNDQPWASNDGGLIYGPGTDGTGESKAGTFTSAEGQRRMRSYGSMTYAGLKSFIYAGLTKDDPRVKAAFDWCRKNWTMEENPGMREGNPDWAHAGIYYYYMTMSKALRAYGQPVIETPDGVKHDWRRELIAALAKRQREDGSWVGEEKWMESNPVLVTGYALLALEDAMGDIGDEATLSK